jgi:hypothetical protein
MGGSCTRMQGVRLLGIPLLVGSGLSPSPPDPLLLFCKASKRLFIHLLSESRPHEPLTSPPAVMMMICIFHFSLYLGKNF